MADNKIIPGLKESQEVIIMAVALTQLTLKIEESLNKEEEFSWIKFLASFPGLLPQMISAVAAVKDGVEGIDNVTIEFSKMTPEQQVELKEWTKTQVPDLTDDKVEQFIKDAFAVVIDLWMLIKTYFIKQVANVNTDTQAGPQPA